MGGLLIGHSGRRRDEGSGPQVSLRRDGSTKIKCCGCDATFECERAIGAEA
jgi:hypothetical protein